MDNSDNERVQRWFVVLDGELTTVETKESWSVGKLYEDYSTDADGYYETGSEFNTPADVDKLVQTLAMTSSNKITQSGDTLTLAGTSVLVNSDTQITLIMIPDHKGNAYGLSGEVMSDNNADYEIIQGIAARTLANTFKDRTVDGTAYIVYNDKNDSDLADKIYVVVNECSKIGEATGEEEIPESGSIANHVVAQINGSDVAFMISGSAKVSDKIAALKIAAADELDCKPEDIQVTMNGSNWEVTSDLW